MSDRELERREGGGRDLTKWLAPTAIAGVLIAFALVNAQRVPIDLLVTTRSARLIYVVVFCVALGAALGWFAGRRGRRG